MRAIALVVILALVGCVKTTRSNLVLVRGQQQITEVRPGSCVEQQMSPGEQMINCRDETHSELTPQGRGWIVAGSIGGGVLITALIVWYIVAVASFASAR